jgi:hypothetical protein
MPMPDEQLVFQSIVFMQGDDAVEAMEILDENGPDALLDYLLQWDTDEPAKVSRYPFWGTSDRLITRKEKDSYLVLSYNLRQTYCGLCRFKKGITDKMVQT